MLARSYRLRIRAQRADNKVCLYVKVIPPPAVELAYFDLPEGENVRTTWGTYNEIDTLGFNIWRGTNLVDRVKVNSQLIPSEAPVGGSD